MAVPSETKDTPSQISPHKGHSRKKKKRPLWQKILAVLGLLLLLILGCAWGYVNHMLNKINRPDYETVALEDFVEETDASLPDDPSLETLSPDDITLQLADQLLKDKDVINILLIGQDTQENVSGTRSDSMILATINQEKKEITVTSFMRDLYVEIPGYRSSRINTAYTLGGAELLDETIELNFGIHIDGNIAIDFTGFAKCVDIIGGVDIEVAPAEAACINWELYKKQPTLISGTALMSDRFALRGGMQHLTGAQALQYARIREIDSDFGRTNRQRKLLSALFEKLKTTDLGTMNELMGEALPLLTTDLSNTKLIGYAAGVLTMQPMTFKTDRIPADGTYRNAVVRSMQVLVPDLAKNQQHLKESLYGSDSTSYVPITSTRKSSQTAAPKPPAATQAPAPAPAQAVTNPYETAPAADGGLLPGDGSGMPSGNSSGALPGDGSGMLPGDGSGVLPGQSSGMLPGQVPAESSSSQAAGDGTYEYGPGMPSYSESQGQNGAGQADGTGQSDSTGQSDGTGQNDSTGQSGSTGQNDGTGAYTSTDGSLPSGSALPSDPVVSSDPVISSDPAVPSDSAVPFDSALLPSQGQADGTVQQDGGTQQTPAVQQGADMQQAPAAQLEGEAQQTLPVQ